MVREQCPRPAGVCAGRAQVTDRHPQRERPIEAGMREKHLAAGVYGVEDALVELIQLRGRKRQRGRPRAKADGRERNGREALEIGMLIHARGELLRKTDVLAEDAAELRRAKMPKDHPKL